MQKTTKHALVIKIKAKMLKPPTAESIAARKLLGGITVMDAF